MKITGMKGIACKYSIEYITVCLYLVFVITSCKPKGAPEKALFSLQDSTITHINFVNSLKETNKLNILDYLYFYNGAGVSAGDINNDGLTDLYFVSNQGKNKLYLNKGNFTFEDISATAGVEGFSDWQTGVTMADVNGDGYLDIYVCAVGNFKGLEGANELYINNGDLTFSEKAADYGVDFTGFSTQAAFFDYDRDGDLDMYLLNHAIHTSRSYDRVSTRSLQNNEAGDYLLENQHIAKNETIENNKIIPFKDVSAQAGIYQASMGYGLGIAVADLNNDGWDDIYVSNDFHEDDYYYINQGDGTFKESVKEHFRHLSRFSMGCDAADMNNDGYQDIMTLDMYPEDEVVEKSSAGEDPFDIFLYKLQFGYFNQYSRNCLQLSLSGEKFSDIAAMSGVAATDWSWSTLLADYNNDGNKDIFITNGIVRRPNDLDYAKFATEDSMVFAQETSTQMDAKAIALMPEGKVHNYIFSGTDSLKFQDKSLLWGFDKANISNGAAYADLDNDGDLDLITNNINESAGVYKNNNQQLFTANFIKVKLKGEKHNTFGVGAKVVLKHNGKMQLQQLMPTRGFQSSIEPILHFGLKDVASIDTIMIIWPNQQVEIKTNVKANVSLVLDQKDAVLDANVYYETLYPKPVKLFSEISSPIDYEHNENPFYDFQREALIPFHVSTEGPKIAVGDINADGRDDFYVGGAKWQPGKLFTQDGEGKFIATNEKLFRADSIYEDVDAVFFDADNDKDVDLYVVSGGNEFYDEMEQQFDRLYINDGVGQFTRSAGLPKMFSNKSCVRPCDFDEDGDIDLFVGGRVTSYKYEQIPTSYLLVNDGKGNFTDKTSAVAPALQKAGMITDGVWTDYDKDGDADLVVVGDWMPVKFFVNNNNKLTEALDLTGWENVNGFWQTIKAADFDGDGDEDFVVGNLGVNTKLRKGNGAMLRLYAKDFDRNESTDHILSYSKNGEFYPIATQDELSKQLPLLKKKFISYKNYAGKTVDEIFSNNELVDAQIMEVNRFESIYISNQGGKNFAIKALPEQAQVSKVFTMNVSDVDNDGKLDILLGGNFYGVSTYQGRYDASYGLYLKGKGNGEFSAILPTACGFVLEGEVRDIKSINTSTGEVLLVARNGLPLQMFQKSNQKTLITNNQ